MSGVEAQDRIFQYDSVDLSKVGPIVFINAGMDQELFEAVAEFKDVVDDYIDLDTITDYETAEPLALALNDYLVDEELVEADSEEDEDSEDEDEEEQPATIVITSLVRLVFNGKVTLLVSVADMYFGDDDEDDESDEDDGDEESENKKWD